MLIANRIISSLGELRHSYTSIPKPPIEGYTNYRVSRSNIIRMKELKNKIGFRSYNALLTFLIETVNREGVMPLASKQIIFKDSKPVVLTGNRIREDNFC